ncbi:hypothetical protein LINGRAHAP2_LOCUS8129 [Linum grandiflorum]
MKWFVDENGLSHSKSVLAEEMNGLINKAQRFEANNPNLDPDLDDVLDETLLPESQRSPIESHEPSYKVREILEPYPLVHHTVARNFISNVPFNSFLRGNRDTSKHMPVSGHIYALEHCPNLGNPSSLQSGPWEQYMSIIDDHGELLYGARLLCGHGSLHQVGAFLGIVPLFLQTWIELSIECKTHWLMLEWVLIIWLSCTVN